MYRTYINDICFIHIYVDLINPPTLGHIRLGDQCQSDLSDESD